MEPVERKRRTEEKKEFRVDAKNFLVTYSQCPLPKEDVHRWFKEKEDSIAELIVGSETHQDGNKHLHVFVSFTKKKNIRNPRRWDIEGYHPNIQSAKSKDRAREYAMKDGDIVGDFGFSWRNFQRSKADFNAFMHDRRNRTRGDINWPITLPGNRLQYKPNASTKRCNWWIWGPTDVGKTRWFMSWFAYAKYFKIRGGDYPWEGYDGEELVLYDDKLPKLSHILQACQWHMGHNNTVPGKTRYRPYYFRDKTRPCVLVLSNIAPTYESEAFNSRFTIIEVTSRECAESSKRLRVGGDENSVAIANGE